MTGTVGPGADSMALLSRSLNRADWCNWPIDNLILQRAGNKITFCLSTIWRTCSGPGIPQPARHFSCEEVWSWLEAVVTWLNHEHVWDVADVIPPCWPQHPHLVHEIAVLADQRHRAGQALSSDPLEEWHRHSLPEFTERMKTRLRNHCQEDHQSWPAKGRYSRHVGEASRRRRMDAYAGDVRALKSTDDQDQSPRLGLVDLETGEIKQP